MSLLFVTVLIAKLLANKVYKASAIFSVSDFGFTVTWTKNFSVFAEPDYDFPFNNLQEYVFEPWGETYRLKVKTQEGKTVKFLFKERKNDNISFITFFDDLQNSIRAYNNKDTDPTNDLQVGETFWESKTAQIAAVIIAVILIFAWKKFISEKEVNTNISKLIVATIGALFIILKVVFTVLNRSKPSKKN